MRRHRPQFACSSIRAFAVRPDFASVPGTLSVIAVICRRLDGLPLAVELAAARIDHREPETMLQWLERRLPLLIGGSRDLPTRLKTMRNAIVGSYDLLSPDEQFIFCQLAVFPGGFILDAAESVVSAASSGRVAEFEIGSILNALGSLVDSRLLDVWGGRCPSMPFPSWSGR